MVCIMYYDVLALSRIFINVIDIVVNSLNQLITHAYYTVINWLIVMVFVIFLFWIIASECTANTHKGCH